MGADLQERQEEERKGKRSRIDLGPRAHSLTEEPNYLVEKKLKEKFSFIHSSSVPIQEKRSLFIDQA